VHLSALPTGKSKEALAAACWPLLIVKDEKGIAVWVMNHEKIHLRQQLSLLIVGSLVLWIIEYIHGRIFLRLSAYETYLHMSGEQEAYLNQNNFNYLQERRLFAQFHYFFHKTRFSNNRDTGEITLL